MQPLQSRSGIFAFAAFFRLRTGRHCRRPYVIASRSGSPAEQRPSTPGHVTICAMSRAGWLLAQALRMIGAPLPLARQTGLPTIVTVTEEYASSGQNWTRVYARKSGFPQVIHSTKRFSGPTGLEEYIGHGIRMALTLSVDNGTLVFTSAAYFIDFGRLRLRVPRWLAPGQTVVTHRETAGDEFLFTLDLTHPWLGTLIHQEALYTEVQACSGA